MQLPATAPGYGAGSYWTVALLGAVGFFAGIVAHELGHAFVARTEGVPVYGITLWFMGGVAQMGPSPASPRAEARIALAGPVAGFGVAAVYGLMSMLATGWLQSPLVGRVLVWLALINLVLSLFNLLPASPLDGGRLLGAALWWRSGDKKRSHIAAARLGRVLAVAIVLVGLWRTFSIGPGSGLWLAMVGGFVLLGAQNEIEGAEVESAIEDKVVAEMMSTHLRTVSQSKRAYELLEAVGPLTPPTAYLVYGDDNRMIGLVTTKHLMRLTPEEQATRPLADLAIPVEDLAFVRSDQGLMGALLEVTYGQSRKAVVVDVHGRPVGFFGAREVDAVLLASDTESALGR